MNQVFFDKLSQIKKDDEQLKAYNSQDNTVVLAGPGSGKTSVLTLKVMRLLDEYIKPPRGLACVTYSNESSREFKTRLKNMGLTNRSNVFLGTVHSFCLSEIIFPFAEIYPQYKIPLPIKIISSREKMKFYKEAKSQTGFDDLNLKIEEMDKERTRDISGMSIVNIPSYDAALKIASIFEPKLVESGYVDFVGIVKYATLLIQQQEYIRKCIEAKFPWLIIDEYQDLGKPLHEMILYLLANTNIKIFAVGDPDQSIYDFQGASPEYLLELSNRIGEENSITLKNNYRSSENIIKASEAVLNQERNYVAKGKLKNYPANIEFYVCEEDMYQQYDKAIEIAKKYSKIGVPTHEIAILVGQQSELSDLSIKCKANGLDFYVSKYPFDRTDFIKWMERCMTWTLDNSKESFDNIYQYWAAFLNESDYCIDKNAEILKRRYLFNVLNAASRTNVSLIEWVSYIIDSLNIREVFQDSKRYPDEIINLDKLIKCISEEPLNNYTVNQFSTIGTPKNQVVLSTRHGSKGLEFDIVIMLGMEEGRFPWTYKSTQRQIDEAHRLCFVCVSRARKQCILVRSKVINIPKNDGSIWRKEFAPSRFWNILYDNSGQM